MVEQYVHECGLLQAGVWLTGKTVEWRGPGELVREKETAKRELQQQLATKKKEAKEQEKAQKQQASQAERQSQPPVPKPAPKQRFVFEDPEALQNVLLQELDQPGGMPPAQSSSSQGSQARREKPPVPSKEPGHKKRSVVREVLEKKRKIPVPAGKPKPPRPVD